MGGQFHFVRPRSSAVNGCVIFLVCFHNIERFIYFGTERSTTVENKSLVEQWICKQDGPTDKEE